MKITIAQLNYTIGAFAQTYEKMANAVLAAKEAGSDLVIFSELAATGYPPRDVLERRAFVEQNMALVERLAKLSDDRLGIIVGCVEPNKSDTGKRLFNCAALLHQGMIGERRHKMLLPTYDVFDEDRYFEPALEVTPIEFKGVKLAVTICEDIWNDKELWRKRLYDRDPVDELAAKGADLIINISASPFAIGKAELRRSLVRQKAVKHGLYAVYVNQVGGNDELLFDGHSMVVDPTGAEVVRGKDFAEDILHYEIQDSVLRDRSIAAPGGQGTLREVSDSEVEEAYRALVLGLHDYTQKCGFNKVVLGLSGGIDSALTAALAAAAIGPKNVLGVALPSRFSSEGSVKDAEALARNLGIEYRLVPIDGVFQAYLDGLAPIFAGMPMDVAEENIQARIRGAILMAISNKFGSLLLTTGNKSELAVGYCTLYGDMCGGLAAISDVPKTLVYKLAYYVNRDRELIPSSSITKPPSAELRPNQTDQDTLPPYDVLDRILSAYVEQGLEVDDIVKLGIERKVVTDIVRKINLAEYKRRQAAPGIKLSGKAFGVGRRYPIAADYRALER
jgi:NAD+ synthetase